MRQVLWVVLLFSLTACGKWSQQGDGWWRESNSEWHSETGRDGWHAESGDSWYGSQHKEEGNQCNIYGRCGK